ncbi:hypothetical protein Tco_0519853 [Tanacetum coccineum]
MVKPVWNNAQRVNHQNFAKKTHPCVKKNLVPRAVLMKSSLVSINTARQVNVAHSKTTVNAARPMSYLSKTAHSTVKRHIHNSTTFKNSNINQRVNTVRGNKFNTARPKAVVNAIKGNNFNVVKASTCWVWKPKHKGNPQMDLQDQGVIDSGCSRHMTGSMSYLTDYKEINGGYVVFGGNPKRGKITVKCRQIIEGESYPYLGGASRVCVSSHGGSIPLYPPASSTHGIYGTCERRALSRGWIVCVNIAGREDVVTLLSTYLTSYCGTIIMENSMENSIIMENNECKFNGKITVVTLVEEQMSPWKGNLPKLPIESNIVRLATTSIVALEGKSD